MIFNPLFIGENGITQGLIPKSGKLANNKYLFSDIVKVVMNPSTKVNGKPSLKLNGMNSELKLGLESEQKFVQLKYRLLSDEHSEQVKSELADILPADIAQLIINEELVTTNDKAISYISKEPLKGELQNFLHNLIGTEIIEQNISKKSGLLLNLEDQKSAVNIELVKDNNGKSPNDKIIVQTLVVPEKSRLLSILGNGNNNEALFRTSGNSADKLFASSSEIKFTNGQTEIIKPTLSVYSFSHDGKQFESLTKNIRSNETFKHNLDLLKNNSDDLNLTASKVHRREINLVPRELKNSSVNADGTKTKGITNNINTDLKLVNPNEVKKESDYSVSKITIVKKQDENSLLNSIKSKSELTPKEFESALRRIDFNNKVGAQKSELHLIKGPKNSITQNDKNLNLVNSKLREKPNSTEINKTNLESVETKTNKSENNIRSIKADGGKTQNSNQVERQGRVANENEVKPSSDGKIASEKSSTHTNTIKINSKSSDIISKLEKNESTGNIKTETKTSDIKPNTENSSKEIFLKSNIESSKNYVAVNDKEKAIINKPNENIKVDSSVNNKSISAEQSVNESTLNSNLKSDLKHNNIDQEKNISLDQEKKAQEKDNSQAQKENQEVKAPPQNLVNPSIENTEAKDNKKFSVKVKGGVKSVSNTSESIKNVAEEKSTTSNTANNDNSNSESNESKNSQSSSSKTNVSELKQNTETNFQQTLNKSEIGQVNSNEIKATFAEPKAAPHIIKSVEVIKEISEFISKQQKGSLSFDIRPEHLGKMKITLDTVDKMLKAHIEVETEQAKHLVEKNIDKLQQQLSNNGLQLNSLNISLSYSKQQKDDKKLNNKTQNDSENLGQMGETEEENNKKQFGYNTYEYIA